MKIDEKNEIKNKNINESNSGKKNTNMLLAAFVIFIFPILAIFIGAFIGGRIGEALETSIITLQVAGGIIGLLLSAIIIKLFDKSSKTDKNAEKIYWDDL